MTFAISDLRSQLQYGGARPTLFEVQLTFPAVVGQRAAQETRFTVSGAEIPPSNLGTIQVPYFGRVAKYPGDRQFAPWTVTIINDEDFLVRDALEEWHNQINARRRNIRQGGTSIASNMKANAIVRQFGRTGESDVLRAYQFQGLWPSQIEGIALDWGAIDQYEQFRVTFEYDWYDPIGKTKTGTAS